MNKKNRTPLFTLLVSTYCQLVCAQPNFIALADYYDEYDKWNAGSAIMMNDVNGKWTFNNKIDNMPASSFFQLSTLDCNKHHCVIAGSYALRGATYYTPLLISSSDHGASWRMVDQISGPAIKAHYLAGQINKIKCSESICLAIGMGYDKFSAQTQAYPIFISQDAGLSWSAPQIKGYDQNQALTDLACIGKQCIAMNQYGQYILSKNSLNWESITLPIDKLRIKSVAASEKNFIVAAQQQTTLNSISSMLLFSNDKGRHFTIQNQIDLSNVYIDDIACNQNSCLLSGTTKGKNKRPVAWVSKNGGKTWTSVIDKIKFPSNMVSLILHKSVCTSHTCAIMGTHHNGLHWYPLLITIDLSQDHLTMSNDAFSGAHVGGKLEFNDITCTSSDCLISGDFQPAKDIKTYPTVFSSDTKMQTWKAIQAQGYSQEVTSIELQNIIVRDAG